MVETTVGYSSSEDEEVEDEKKQGSQVRSELAPLLREVVGVDDDVLVEPEFRGLWESAPPKPRLAPSKFRLVLELSTLQSFARVLATY